MKMAKLHKMYLRGEKFKNVSEIDLGHLPIKHPVDLVGSSLIMQELAKRHSKALKKNNK